MGYYGIQLEGMETTKGGRNTQEVNLYLFSTNEFVTILFVYRVKMKWKQIRYCDVFTFCQKIRTSQRSH